MYHSLIDIDLLEKGLHEKDFLANVLFVCYNEVAATSNLTKGGCIYDLGDVYDCVCCGRYSDALYLQMA